VKAFLEAFHQDADIKELPRCDYGVFRALCFLAGKSNGDCFPHRKTIGQISRYSTCSVKRAIRKLVKRGYLHVQREYLVTPKGKRLIVRNRYFFRKWARLENGIWSNGIQKWEDGVTEIRIIESPVRQAAPEADPQGGGGVKMAPGVGSNWTEGWGQGDPLSKGTLNKGKSDKGEKAKKLSLSEKSGAGERENPLLGKIRFAPGEKTSLRSGEDGEERKDSLRSGSLKDPETFSVTSSSEPGNGARPEELPLQGNSGSMKVSSAAGTLRTPPAITLTPGITSPDNGDLQKVGPAAQCTCDSEHPPGMPSLQEIRAELSKLKGAPSGVLLAEDAEELHDAWLVNGFEVKSGCPIRNWKASLRNWKRWQEK